MVDGGWWMVDGEVDQREGGDVGDTDELGGVAGLEVLRVKNHGRHGGGDAKGTRRVGSEDEDASKVTKPGGV